MSETPKVELGGHNAKDWALIAIANPESNIVLTGSLDISQWTVVILGIAIVAVTVVTQQLTAKAQQAAVAATDKVWLESEALAKKG
jgi:hypothetical protein